MSDVKDILIERDIKEPKHFFEDEEWLNGCDDFELAKIQNNYEERTVKKFPDYKVSNYGDIISYKNSTPRKMVTWTNQHGHEYTRLVDRRGKKKTVLIHRTVADEFIPKTDSKYDVVRHLDDNPHNNHVNNLAWGTQKDNINDMRLNGNMYMVPVYCYELDKIFESCKEAGEYLGLNKSIVTMNCRGQIHSAGGMHFCYLSDKDEKKWNLQVGAKTKPVIATNLLTGKELYFKSRRDAAEGLKIPDCGISSVITGHLRQTHNWTFREAEV